MVSVIKSRNTPLNMGKLGSGGGSVVPGDLTGTYNTTVQNHGAETGDMTGWTFTNVETTTNEADVPGPHEGTYFFVGASAAEGSMRQTLALTADEIALADVGRLLVRLKWQQGGRDGDDDGLFPVLHFYDFDENLLGTVRGDYLTFDNEQWNLSMLDGVAPMLTRRVDIEFEFIREGGTKLNCYVDSIEVDYVDNGVISVDRSRTYMIHGTQSNGVTVRQSKTFVVHGNRTDGVNIRQSRTFVILE